jgi:RimK family alpha-L-glutamate ligase
VSSLIIAGRLGPTNVGLLDAASRLGLSCRLLPPELAARRAAPEDIVLGRVDVSPSLDGPEPGLDALRRLETEGVRVLNTASSLVAAHDKLETARVLASAGLPHPATVHVLPGAEPEPWFEPPYVLKPRFGSWGKGVVRCASMRELRGALAALEDEDWFRGQGVLVQELVSNPGADLRVLVADGIAIGAISRVAAPGEWRTNIALGGHRRPVVAPYDAEVIAAAAAEATGGHLVGVDLLPSPAGWVALEINGCVDFNDEYSRPDRDVFEDAVVHLVFPGVAALASRRAP